MSRRTPARPTSRGPAARLTLSFRGGDGVNAARQRQDPARQDRSVIYISSQPGAPDAPARSMPVATVLRTRLPCGTAPWRRTDTHRLRTRTTSRKPATSLTERLPAQRQQDGVEQDRPNHDRVRHQLHLHHDRRQCRQRPGSFLQTSALHSRTIAPGANNKSPRWPTGPTTTLTPCSRAPTTAVFILSTTGEPGSLKPSPPMAAARPLRSCSTTAPSCGSSQWTRHPCGEPSIPARGLHRPHKQSHGAQYHPPYRWHSSSSPTTALTRCWSAASTTSPMRQSPMAVADSDAGGNLANWRAFGVGLPNTFVYQMSYNQNVDLLAVSLFGRSAGCSSTRRPTSRPRWIFASAWPTTIPHSTPRS